MANRIRHVYPTSMVAHLWVHRVQGFARNGGSNFYFEGDTIYSYGSHFPIAKHVETKRGRAVLLTTQGYSVTTARHKCIVERACRHLTVYHVQYVCCTNRKGQFDEYRQRYIGLARKFSKARSNKPWILDSLRDLVDEANRFAEFFGIRSRLSLPDDTADMVAECKAIEQREKASKQREQAKQRKEAIERAEQWARGKVDYLPPAPVDTPIRLRITGDELQTSRGARVPVAHAIKAFRIIKRLHDRGQAYERNGHTIHLGHFALDAVDTQGNVTAGCHHVEWSEIERIATIAGVN